MHRFSSVWCGGMGDAANDVAGTGGATEVCVGAVSYIRVEVGLRAKEFIYTRCEGGVYLAPDVVYHTIAPHVNTTDEGVAGRLEIVYAPSSTKSLCSPASGGTQQLTWSGSSLQRDQPPIIAMPLLMCRR